MVASPPSPAAPEAYALAYDEAKRALEEQDRVVTELRSRAGVLMAAAAITTSFLGDRILSGSHVHPLAWIAIGCFVALGLTVLILLWPWRDWKFTINAQSFIQSYLEPEDDEPLDLAAPPRPRAPHGGQLEEKRTATPLALRRLPGRSHALGRRDRLLGPGTCNEVLNYEEYERQADIIDATTRPAPASPPEPDAGRDSRLAGPRRRLTRRIEICVTDDGHLLVEAGASGDRHHATGVLPPSRAGER